ncbi:MULTISPECIES: hypothetical protein [Furfurilactobacillus]
MTGTAITIFQLKYHY